MPCGLKQLPNTIYDMNYDGNITVSENKYLPA